MSLYPGWSTTVLTHRLLRCQTGTKQARYRALCAPVNVPEPETKRPTDAHEGQSGQERPRLEHRTSTGETGYKTRRGTTRSQVCTQRERQIEIVIHCTVWARSRVTISLDVTPCFESQPRVLRTRARSERANSQLPSGLCSRQGPSEANIKLCTHVADDI